MYYVRQHFTEQAVVAVLGSLVQDYKLDKIICKCKYVNIHLQLTAIISL